MFRLEGVADIDRNVMSGSSDRRLADYENHRGFFSSLAFFPCDMFEICDVLFLSLISLRHSRSPVCFDVDAETSSKDLSITMRTGMLCS